MATTPMPSSSSFDCSPDFVRQQYAARLAGSGVLSLGLRQPVRGRCREITLLLEAQQQPLSGTFEIPFEGPRGASVGTGRHECGVARVARRTSRSAWHGGHRERDVRASLLAAACPGRHARSESLASPERTRSGVLFGCCSWRTLAWCLHATEQANGAIMAVYGYARVSTARQADEGESLEVQERTVAGYALMHGMAVDRMFVERGVSGSVPLGERPQGAALLQTLRPGDVVVIAKLDRAFRSALDALAVLEDLKGRKVSLHIIDLGGDVTGNGISKLVFTILSAVAEAERDRIRERVQTVKADQKARGRYLGGKIPFGYRVEPDERGGVLVPVEAEQEILRAIGGLRREGRPLRAIQAALAERGTRLSLAALHRIVHDQEARSA